MIGLSFARLVTSTEPSNAGSRSHWRSLRFSSVEEALASPILNAYTLAAIVK